MALRAYQVSDGARELRDFICRLIETDVLATMEDGNGLHKVVFYAAHHGKFDDQVRPLMERLVEIANDG